MPNSSNILLVGAGLTSSLTAFLLRNHIDYIFDVWEARDNIGGRMRTFRSEHSSIPIDLGFQYLTTNETRFQLYHTVYDSLISNNLIKPLTCRVENLRPYSENTLNYVAPQGTSSLVEHFFASSNVRNIRTSRPVRSLDVRELAVSPNDSDELFDAVIITPPVPDVLKIQGSFRETLTEELIRKLDHVKYSSRFVLVLTFDRPLNVTWAATYLPQDEVFRYVAIQEKKVGASSCHFSVVFHTSIDFGTQYNAPEEAQPILEEHARRIFPQWSEPLSVRCFSWTHSQVTSSYETSPGCIVLRTNPLMIVTGDGFTTSNFDGCVAAATSTVDTLLDVLVN